MEGLGIDGDVVRDTVSLEGEIDIAAVPGVRERLDALFDAGCTSLVVDLSGVVFIDSSGLGVLISALRRARERGGSVSVVGANEDVARLFGITGLDGLFGMGEPS